MIIGRTDSAQVLGMDEALIRLKLAADAGADVCFIEGVRTAELLTATVEALAPKPVLVNVISGGLTPSFTTKEAEALGAKIISEFAFAFAFACTRPTGLDGCLLYRLNRTGAVELNQKPNNDSNYGTVSCK